MKIKQAMLFCYFNSAINSAEWRLIKIISELQWRR